MSALEVVLSAALVLALVALFVLAVTLPRRVERLMTSQPKESAAAKDALQEAVAAQITAAVGPLRELQEEQAKQTTTAAAVAAELLRGTGAMRALLEWFFAFASAQYMQAAQRSAPVVEPTPRNVERAAPPAVEPPGSAAPAPPRRALGSAPTMPAMQSPAAPSRRPAPPIEVEDRAGERGPGGGP